MVSHFRYTLRATRSGYSWLWTKISAALLMLSGTENANSPPHTTKSQKQKCLEDIPERTFVWSQVNIESYQEWIQLVADFTISSLASWQWAKGSVMYLLGLWSRLVSSMPYLKGETPSLLETYVPKIMDAYITSR